MFSELADGPSPPGAFIVNSGDVGLLRSLERISAEDASRSVNDGATIAAHAAHLRYGLSLMNRWASEGGDPFADATWDKAWTTRHVEAPAWEEIRNGLRDEAHRWRQTLNSARQV
ncbi:MAG TPA: DinB family protein, partial [Steroidobacteraceae bacterium]|nr:DinB family protein [Steroidobacteraceae bacterium]